ncbi:MAG: hypothetical protein LC737_06435 [Chloroflexi bacterium]|nr:hypothetical protein [Chloroflexota bacterium]
MSADEVLHSLQRRIAAMHMLWRHAASDITLAQVNHHERAGVLPIAFSFYHFVRGEDSTISRMLLREPTLWERDNWAARVGVNIADARRGLSVSEAEQIRFADLGAWRDYLAQVFARTETALHALAPGRLNEILYQTVPDTLRGAFITYVAGEAGPIRLEHALECFVYQHGIRHMGEMEHARALVGLGGMT